MTNKAVIANEVKQSNKDRLPRFRQLADPRNDIKSQFPIFEKNPGLVYLDSGATALKPQMVLDKMWEYYTDYSANVHRGVFAMSERATAEYELARGKVAKFIGTGSDEIIFTSGTTAAINMVARSWGEANIGAGDEIVVTEMEHHSNLVPWQELAKRKNLELKFLPINQNPSKPALPAGRSPLDKGDLDLNTLEKLISERTKILAITHVSNVLGTINPIKEITARVKKINPEIIVVVDGAQAVAHMPVDVAELGADFYAFSGHKMYGPTGIGVLWGKKELLEKMEPSEFGGGMIAEVTKDGSTWAVGVEKFEAGTPPIAEVIGLGAAIDFINQVGWEAIKKQESSVLRYLLEELKKLKDVNIFSAGQAGVVSFVVDGVHPHDVATILDREGICVRAGHHCAMPLHQVLGVEATTRVSLGIYSTREDVDKLITGISKAKEIFNVKTPLLSPLDRGDDNLNNVSNALPCQGKGGERV